VESTTDLLALLPHSEPFRFVSAVTGRDAGSIEGYYDVPLDHPVVRAHFPDDPLVPGTILLEAMAQLAALGCAELWDRGGGPPRLAAADRTRWVRGVRPDQRVHLRSAIAQVAHRGVRCDVAASTDEGEVARASLLLVFVRSIGDEDPDEGDAEPT
jgi:3-hydroxyacyl-[acyl-carrier-protein] dehydratase